LFVGRITYQKPFPAPSPNSKKSPPWAPPKSKPKTKKTKLPKKKKPTKKKKLPQPKSLKQKTTSPKKTQTNPPLLFKIKKEIRKFYAEKHINQHYVEDKIRN
jgi:hypothetical protein